jgi:DNA invertase Pin-like site-specific DNA recombinase
MGRPQARTGGWLRRRRRLAPDPTTCWSVARSSLSRWVRRPGPCPNPNERARSAILFLHRGVSTDDQNLALQLDALKQADCRRVFRDVGSGSLSHRPELDACLQFLGAGDTLVVWRLDRLGRGLKHLIEAIENLHDREIGFRSLTEQIDTTTSAGRLQFHIFGALAEFEREIIRERTRAGLAAARARGRLSGRPRLVTAQKLAAAQAMRAQQHTMAEISSALGISRAPS